MTKLKTIKHNLSKTADMLNARGDVPEIPIKSLPELNGKIWGLHKKKITLLGARTSNGKSALALQLAWDTASQGIPTLFLSLEMYEEDIIERLFCHVMRINNIDLLTGKFKKHLEKWNDFEKKIQGIPFIVTDMLGRTWKEIDDYLDSIETKPKVIIIDHIQEARGSGGVTKKDVIEEYMKKLRYMAIKCDLAMVVCSQINRAAPEERHKEPQLHHLKETGYLEEGSDIIILLHWPFYYAKQGDPSKMILRVAKNRNGRTGYCPLKYTPENYLFEDAPAEEGSRKPGRPKRDHQEPFDHREEDPAVQDPAIQSAVELFGGKIRSLNE